MSKSIPVIAGTFPDLIVNIWLWVTVGLIALLAFFGRRILKKWDTVVDSHMPEQEIELRFGIIIEDMKRCEAKMYNSQKLLLADRKREEKKLLESVDKVHERIDELYKLLLNKS